MLTSALLLLAGALSTAQGQLVPVVSSFNAPHCCASFSAPACRNTSLATWSGVPENAFCKPTPGAVSLSITPGTEKNCQIDLYTTSNCNGVHGGFIASPPVTPSCYTASQEFASVRILCITTG
ncbi:hypothetical protein FB45DRAFT_216772 [Roridomyces roridus]|uniref:Uncharacterized protein n=1 Tax=Roridomyces roridus TaxID=1738132 RepID=A0AAD7FGX2_9AGAR|nr:hypothetical protein FB45DRAFT_216772 [Roridomyces roridus]